MIVRYYPYEETIPVIEDFMQSVFERRHRYYASELLRKLVHKRDFQIEPAIRKAITICKLTGIPVQDHFRAVYRCDASGLSRDWKLSELACSLIIVSYDPVDEEVKRIRESFIRSLGF